MVLPYLCHVVGGMGDEVSQTHIFLHVFCLHGLVGRIGWVQGAKDEPREAGRVTGPLGQEQWPLPPSSASVSPWVGKGRRTELQSATSAGLMNSDQWLWSK